MTACPLRWCENFSSSIEREIGVTDVLAAGAKAAFVARPGMVLGPLGAQPDIVNLNLGDVVAVLLERDAAP